MQALILAGGSGTRFWPLSRRKRPKQLLALEGDRSLLQETVDRLHPLIPAENIWVCTNERLAEAVREQLPEVPAQQILCEPEGRNTAPAIGWSLISMSAAQRNEIVAVLPSDHRFGDPEGFRETLTRAGRVAERDDRVMTLGVKPRWAETGYGYLELGNALEGGEEAYEVAHFREKPDAATAEKYLAGGKHLWNAGIFVFKGTTLLRHLAHFEPEIGAGLEAIEASPEKVAELFPTLPSISIDYAVMERLKGIATVPLDCGWSDLGSWEALTEVIPADEKGNRERGDTLALDSSNNLLFADQGQVVTLGVENLVVVRTGDTVLVMPRDRSQDVRNIVDRLKADDRLDLL